MKNKFVLLLIAASFCSMIGFAQGSSSALKPKLSFSLFQSEINAILNAQTAHKGTVVSERIIGTAVRDQLDRLVDSIIYVYHSTNRGSVINNNDFNTYLPFQYAPSNSEITPGVWENTVPASAFDTAWFYVYDTLGVLNNWGRYRIAYNASDKPTGLFSVGYDGSSVPTTQSRYTMTYNSNGDLSTVKYESDTSMAVTGAYVVESRKNISYSGTQRTKDSNSTGTGTLAPDRKITYVYNISGLLATKTIQTWNSVTNSWDNYNYYTYTYDASQRLKTALWQNWNTVTSSYDNYYFDSLGYSGTHTLPVYHSSLNWNTVTMAYETYSLIQTPLAASGNSYTSYTYSNGDGGGGWEPSYKYTVTSNAMDHISTLKIYNYNSGTAGFTDYTGEYWWYYENYDPAGVNNISASDKGYSLYPVPAHNKLMVNHVSGNIELSIYNMNGQLMMEQNQNASGNMQVDISTLAAGTYFASVKEGKTATQIRFIKE